MCHVHDNVQTFSWLNIFFLNLMLIDDKCIPMHLIKLRTYLMSRFKRIIRQTIVFPMRFVITIMANIVVIPIWAESESVYSDITDLRYCVIS